VSRSVLVLGANGSLGQMCATEFAKAGWEVHRAVRRGATGKRDRHVDFDRRETIEEGIGGVDLILNTVFDPALRAEDVVLDRGGLLLNIAAGPLADTQALRARKREPHQGSVVMHGGLTPGLTSLVARDVFEAHPEADMLEMVWTLTGQGYSGAGGRSWAHSYLAARPHSPVFTVPLPEPYGVRKAMQVGEDDRGWLVDLPARTEFRTGVCFYERDTDVAFRLLNSLRLRALVPRRMLVNLPKRMSRGAPRGRGTAPHGACVYWIAALKDGRRITARSIQGEDDYLVTVLGTIALAETLVDLEGGCPTGVQSVEGVMSLSDVAERLSALGVSVNTHAVS